MKITVVGAGHVGVVYAAGLAELGHSVTVIDTDAQRLEQLARGDIWFFEPELSELLRRGIERKLVQVDASYLTGLEGAEFVFVCVPTPTTSDGSLDDSYLRSAFAAIRAHARAPLPIIVNKSTVPVGTGDSAARIFGPDGVQVVSNPEFLAEGTAVRDFFHPHRIVIGAHDARAAARVAALYAPISTKVIITDPVTAELSKIAANAFLAAKVSFANALSEIAQSIGADGATLTEALSADPRVGQGHLTPGMGFGGSCLPKDLAAMEQLARRLGRSAELFGAVMVVNRGQRQRVLDWLIGSLGTVSGKSVAMLGAAFKANTDDTRDSPALLLANELAELHAEVTVYDPVVARFPANAHVRLASSVMEAAAGADALILATDWPEFAAVDLPGLRSTMRGDVLIDGRGLWDAHVATELGFRFFSFATTSRSADSAEAERARVQVPLKRNTASAV